MAEGVLINIAESLINHLASTTINEIALAWGFHARLIRLQDTVNTIKDVLLDAEEKQLHSHAVRGWVQRLKAVVYEADNLFDEFSTMALQKKAIHGNKFTREVTSFFSSTSNPIKVSFSISNKIKKIMEKLDEIDQDGKRFDFVIRPLNEPKVVHNKNRETYSFVDVEQIVGREDDKKAILDILDGYQDQRVCVVPIVGMGGLGKTTLAQLVYKELQKDFDLSMWVCVSEDFDVKEMVRKFLKSTTKTEPQNLDLDPLYKELQSQITGKKYLLVLDDVWNDKVEKWLELSAMLKVGKEGSKIIVTTRLMKVAEIMSTIHNPYKLKGLSTEKSLILFRRMAFLTGPEESDPELLSIGKEIVGKCANVPLAIRALGSLLRGRDKQAWVDMKDRNLAEIPENDNHIIAILEISYQHLNSPLKNCFAYCALFPKDIELEKRMLINLWMAQGFVIPAYKSQSLEEAGEEYFLTLFQRGFFQNITRDGLGNIESCKMHDLFHDLAIKVAGIECKVAKLEEMDIDQRTNHMSIGYCLTSSRKIPSWKALRNLRTLRIDYLLVTALPSGFQHLSNLRSLQINSCDGLESLPEWVGCLSSLEHMELKSCPKLTCLPEGFRKLTSLTQLIIEDCGGLTDRCRGPNGEDWPKIKHIPFVRVLR